MLAKALIAAGGNGQSSVIYSDEVFSAYTYTGTGASQTITNGIDLAGEGGLLWTKVRSTINDHWLVNSEAGATKGMSSNSTAQQTTDAAQISSFTSTGYVIGTGGSLTGDNGATYVSWAFRKAPKFFDVVTFTTDGSGSGGTVAHSLGQAPGMVIFKRTVGTDGIGWLTYHRSLTTNYTLLLNTTAAQSNQGADLFGASSTTTLSPRSLEASASYVAYLFAHDTDATGLIQCGSFTTDGSGNATVTLGWEPQFLIAKVSTMSNGWYMLDTARGWSVAVTASQSMRLEAQSSSVESNLGDIKPTATGFVATGSLNTSQTYIYLAIRRPNKPPTLGTQVYNAIARTGTGAAATVTGVGFAPDFVHHVLRASAGSPQHFCDRLRGRLELASNSTAAEVDRGATYDLTAWGMDGISVGLDFDNWNKNTFTEINHFFKRAPGCFDVVCYTGTGSATTVAHGLGVVPELMIVKSRSSGTEDWAVYTAPTGATYHLRLNSVNALAGPGNERWNGTTPTASVFSVGTSQETNLAAATYVWYGFATAPGISKVGSYTGNGSTQTINCGFSTGARFFLVKASSTTGSWWVYDSVRGIVSSFDPALQLNSTAAEVTTADAVDADASGIVVNEEATCSINANGISYVFLALA